MPTTRALQGVLNSFLDAFKSRYSAYRGYWLFGFLVTEPALPPMDLLARDRTCLSDVLAAATRRAVQMFADQLAKAGFTREDISSAHLKLTRLSFMAHGRRQGNLMSLEVVAKHRCGKVYAAQRIIFASPHDPQLELRSGDQESQ
jgi:hypothetical protein